MFVDVKALKIVVEDHTRTLLEDRAKNSFGRFASMVSRVEITLKDLNGPRGGVDKACVAVVKLRPRGEVRVEHRGVEVSEAVSAALARLKAALAREADRRQEPRRQLQRQIVYRQRPSAQPLNL